MIIMIMDNHYIENIIKNPQTNSVIYYYDNSGNVIETKTYDEKGAIVDVQKK